jgi:hypothetical protein
VKLVTYGNWPLKASAEPHWSRMLYTDPIPSIKTQLPDPMGEKEEKGQADAEREAGLGGALHPES